MKINNTIQRINNLGWVKGLSKGTGNAGETLEKTLGLSNNNLPVPDLIDFELKTMNYAAQHKFGSLTLFNLTPDGKYPFETFRLKDDYGSPDKDFPNKKVLYTTLYSNYYKLVNKKYFFNLLVDYKQKKVLVRVFDINMNLLEKFVYWDFDDIKEVVKRKASKILLVKVTRKIINTQVYFKYHNPIILELKSFNHFLSAIEKGHIKIVIKVGLYKKNYRFLKAHDRGTSFDIKKDSLGLVYNLLSE